MLLGALTGLVPGIHLNTFIPLLSGLGAGMAPFIVSAAVSGAVFCCIPAALLGIPSEASALSVLPAHRLALRGKSLKAIRLSVAGALASSCLLFIMLPALFLFSGIIAALKPLLPLAVAATLLMMLLSSKRRAETILIFALSAALGSLSLQSMGSAALLPMLGGFFGMSAIVGSLLSHSEAPPQETRCTINLKAKPMLFAAIAATMCSFIPAASSSVGAMAAKKLGNISGSDEFIAAVGGVGAIYSFMSLLSIWLIGSPRSGAGVILSGMRGVSPLIVVGSAMLSLAVSCYLVWMLSPKIVSIAGSLGSRRLNVAAFAILVSITLLFSGAHGAVILTSSSAIGILCMRLRVARSSCMASLLIPLLLAYAL